MTAGMAILVGSFEKTMQRWIAATFQADLYVSSSGAENASSQNRLRAATWQRLVADPAVASANVMHSAEVTFPGGTATVLGVDFRFAREQGSIAWLGGAPEPWPDAGDAAFVSEAFVERFRVRRGDALSVPTPTGPQSLRIAGVFADYGSERGTVLVERARFTAWFRDDTARSVIVKLRDPAAAETVRTRWLAESPGVQIFTNAHLRTEVLRMFRQTFSITYALEAIGVVVAVLGLTFTLASVLLDRHADLTTLRALGVTRRGIALSTALEGAATALAGLLAGFVASGLLGWLLIHVINKQTFGWTLLLGVPAPALLLLAALVLLAALAAATAVGLWGAGLPADREE
jgi:putative ABC transport system permease protein